MIEKERKFLMRPGTHTVDVDTTKNIEQGYLMLEEDKQLRVRIIDNLIAFIAFKVGDGIERNEYEYQVPLEDAREMMSNTKIKLKKIRHSYIYRGNQIDIDEYPDGMKVIEIEFKNYLGAEDIPDYCDTEVSNQPFYSNIEIAKRHQSIEAYTLAQRVELAAKEEEELILLEKYLPVALTHTELIAVVRQIKSVTPEIHPGKLFGMVNKASNGLSNPEDIKKAITEE